MPLWTAAASCPAFAKAPPNRKSFSASPAPTGNRCQTAEVCHPKHSEEFVRRSTKDLIRRYSLHNQPAIDTTPQMADTPPPRHSFLVRVTHWLITLAFLALLVTGLEIVVSHPRFYWGETGNVNTQPLFKIPIPASRNLVPTAYGYVMPDQNGWSRYLHFQSAWLLVLVGLLYVAVSFFNGHFRRNLLPSQSDVSPKQLATSIAQHLRFAPPGPDEAWSYNVLQRLAYLFVIFIFFPLIIWTGLAMSPSFVSAFPAAVNILGGQQSARTLHFFLTGVLVLFLLVHIFMVFLAGFRNRVRAMITGRAAEPLERA
jgi:thiosulfate reductase cytochrome b subunit